VEFLEITLDAFWFDKEPRGDRSDDTVSPALAFQNIHVSDICHETCVEHEDFQDIDT